MIFRNFVRGLAIISAAVSAGFGVGQAIYKSRSKQREREALISKALETPEGREALSQAMVEPIRRAMEYHAIGGRRLKIIDELPR